MCKHVRVRVVNLAYTNVYTIDYGAMATSLIQPAEEGEPTPSASHHGHVTATGTTLAEDRHQLAAIATWRPVLSQPGDKKSMDL